jgi:probable addiction module antidote protein
MTALAGTATGKGHYETQTEHIPRRSTIRELRNNPEFAAEYLRAALEDNDEPSVLLIALRRVAEARGGIAKVAKAAGIERESLYRALSVRGNPRLSTLVAVTKAAGLKLTVEAAQS